MWETTVVFIAGCGLGGTVVGVLVLAYVLAAAARADMHWHGGEDVE